MQKNTLAVVQIVAVGRFRKVYGIINFRKMLKATVSLVPRHVKGALPFSNSFQMLRQSQLHTASFNETLQNYYSTEKFFCQTACQFF